MFFNSLSPQAVSAKPTSKQRTQQQLARLGALFFTARSEQAQNVLAQDRTRQLVALVPSSRRVNGSSRRERGCSS